MTARRFSLVALRDRRAHELAALAGLPLSLSQLAVLKAADGAPLNRAELRALRSITGTRFAKVNPLGYRVLAIQAGRQSGKTRHLLAPLIVRHALRTVKRAPGETLYVPCVGPAREHAAVLVDAVAALASALGILHERLTGEVRFPALDVIVTVRTASREAGRSTRCLAVVVDEAAFVGSDVDGSAVHDAEVVAALTPGLVTTGGPLLIASTPWARRGYFHELVEKHRGKLGGDVLAVVAPTWAFNLTVTEASTRALATDDRRWRREFGAEALDVTESAFDPQLVRTAVRPGDGGAGPERGVTYGGGYDHSRLRGDHAVLVLGHREEQPAAYGVRERFVVDRVVTWSPGCDPTRQLAELADWCVRYGISRLVADRYDLPHVQSALAGRGIVVEAAGATNADAERELEFILSGFETGRFSIPDHPLLIRELERDVVVERLPGGRVRVRARAGQGRHDDHVHALVRWLAQARTLPASGDGAVRMIPRIARNADGRVCGVTGDFMRVTRAVDGRVVEQPCAPPLSTRLGRDMARARRAQGLYDPAVDLDADGAVIPIPDDHAHATLNVPIRHW
ncbi:MAG: hypothetical protein L6Q84_23540 [Polyangiaceae bacterium]|nr:hypothetical protein [Polyangiaceae bacterium]